MPTDECGQTSSNVHGAERVQGDLAELVNAIHAGDVERVRQMFAEEWQRGFDYAVDTVGEWHGR